MLEERRAKRRQRFDPRPSGIDGSGAADPVTVSHGPYSERLPVADMSVGEIRARYHDRFDLDPASEAILDGTPVSDDTTVKAGQMLMFVHRTGEKG
jgi:hypothetical protein